MATIAGGVIIFAMDSRDDTSLTGDPGASLLLTDLYQLTMLQSYLEHGMTETAVFEFFVRRLPDRRYISIGSLPGSPSGMSDLRSPSKNLSCKAGSHL